MILSLQNTQFKKEAVLRLVDAFLKSFLSKIFHKFIGIFIRQHINYFSGQSRFLQNSNCTQRRINAGAVAVIGKQHLIRITPQQIRLPRRKRRSKRSRRL